MDLSRVTPASVLADYIVPFRTNYITVNNSLLKAIDVSTGLTYLRGLVDMDGSRAIASLDPTNAIHMVTKSYLDFWTARLVGYKGYLRSNDGTIDTLIPSVGPSFVGEVPLLTVDPTASTGVKYSAFPTRISATAVFSGPWVPARTLTLWFSKIGNVVAVMVPESYAAGTVPNQFMSAPAGTIPVVYRPNATMTYYTEIIHANSNQPAYYEVFADGSMTVKTFSAGGFFNLGGNSGTLKNYMYYPLT